MVESNRRQLVEIPDHVRRYIIRIGLLEHPDDVLQVLFHGAIAAARHEVHGGGGGVGEQLLGGGKISLLEAGDADLLEADHFKELFGSLPGGQAALDTIALNAAWVRRAEPELLRHFNATEYAGV
ncbi:unnamed protein product [Plutella xylostella]|uniref:(diamondback moth) hypothetical protein n=1 Tax=Plutella xylostella TaxID=51655 RepID=A0A8S4EWN7_PLUXY|nr:unnamed protein product [Plutella xylostella]